MNTAKKTLYELIKDIPEKDILDIIDYVQFLKLKRERELYNDLLNCGGSSVDFWDNHIDDEAWNNV